MSSSTTLMTFLLEAPPRTRSVNLLGSWDNFSKPYPLSKDSRRGAEHWTCCHNFENIICDGKVSKPTIPRRGGLKMGGTYWYYYQLNNDIDHHNPSEPSTMLCPMLPGQAINVMQVPVCLSSDGQRQIHPSTSSVQSGFRTMDPEDRYLNPRPVPLPSVTERNSSTASRNTPRNGFLLSAKVSIPEALHRSNDSLTLNGSSLRKLRLTGSSLQHGRGRSVSPARRPTGLNTANCAPKPTGSETEPIRGRTTSSIPFGVVPPPGRELRAGSAGVQRSSVRTSGDSLQRSPRSRSTTASMERNPLQSQQNTLLLRQGHGQMQNIAEAFSKNSFSDHRRQRSLSRESSLLRTSSTSINHQRADDHKIYPQPLETLEEVFSAYKSPTFRLPARNPQCDQSVNGDRLLKADSSQGRNKHLPTLPDAPSSAFLPIELITTPPTRAAPVFKGLGRGTSKSTMSDGYYSSTAQSHLSRLTSTTASSFSSSEWSSVLLDGKSPAFSHRCRSTSQPTSPYEVMAYPYTPGSPRRRNSSPIIDTNRLPSIVSCSSVGSYGNTQPPSPASEASGPMCDSLKEQGSLSKRYGMMLGNLQNYNLPTDFQTSKPSLGSHSPPEDFLPHTSHNDFQHANSTQQLLTDLKYLGDVIQ